VFANISKNCDIEINITMVLDYFKVEIVNKVNFIFERKHRSLVNGFRRVVCFGVGDIIEVIYFKGDIPFIFEGVCIVLRKKKMKIARCFICSS